MRRLRINHFITESSNGVKATTASNKVIDDLYSHFNGASSYSPIKYAIKDLWRLITKI